MLMPFSCLFSKFFNIDFSFFSITSLRTELYSQRAILESISSQLGARTNDGRNLLDDF